MVSPNVAAVQGLYERWGEGDFAGGAEVFDPGVVRGFLEPWVRLTIEMEELRPAGGTGGESGVATELRLENFRHEADALAAAGMLE